MKLQSVIRNLKVPQKMILRVAESCGRAIEDRNNEVLIAEELDINDAAGFPLFLLRKSLNDEIAQLPPDLDYVAEGDILRFEPSGQIKVLYRKKSPFNAMLVTERCNSKCLMCSQPPRDIDDDYLIDDWLRAIPLMSPTTPELGITGGEPTLRFDDLVALIHATKERLPATALHMLSNGRLFNYLKYAQRLADIRHHDFMIGIPLYADVDEIHDFVVQAKGAFSQTILGILNLARVKQKVEIRFVIHRHTFARMPQFARFVRRNLPFVDHVTFMGLEIAGYAKSNLAALWIDPVEYQKELEKAVFELASARMNVSIYNLPLCLIPKSVWPFARKSISDWKNIYFEECEPCKVRELCAGFFASAQIRRSAHIRPLGDDERVFADSLWNNAVSAPAMES
jgi:His-Xaa-Ser system radical SAM maturase HxsC